MKNILSIPKIENLPASPYQEVILEKESLIVEQFHRSEHFFLLISGTVSFNIYLEDNDELIEIGSTSEKMTPIGWSGLNEPYRYATSVKVKSDTAVLYQWRIADILHDIENNPEKFTEFTKAVGIQARSLIRRVLVEMSKEYHLPVYSFEHKDENFRYLDEHTSITFLKKSPFFEALDDETIDFFSAYQENRQYRAGDTIFEQDKLSDGLYILEEGWVDYLFHGGSEQKDFLFRSISTPGFIIGWSATLDGFNLSTAKARRETRVIYIPQHAISEFSLKHPEKASEFYLRILWLVSHHLQVVRTKLINFRYNLEQIAIKSLIIQNGTRLALHSQLHKVPFLLSNKQTQGDAIQLLHQLHTDGDSQERHIASLCLDNLQEVTREHLFYEGLIKTFNTVLNSPSEIPAKDVRIACAKTFNEALYYANFSIDGWENLPNEPGCIFIYNHLKNHPYNTLPNNFQITLDSHFLSSKILFNKYNDPGIRVVRIGRGAEYGHQDYYDRLGHIDVYTNESDPLLKMSSYREEKRQEFYKTAGEYLTKGTNLIISPEGTSFTSEESPGPFKSGAFRLALSIEKEPWIVPVVMLNFDKRNRYNRFSCGIEKPFKVSDYVKDPVNRQEMKVFLSTLENKYKEYKEKLIR